MSQPVVECIANYSEARRPEVVEAISQAITSVAGVRLLDRHSDMDHNRTVLTFVGPPQQVEEAAFRSIAKAAELINLDVHRGEHPRIGATDVVPFVPISGIDMKDCVEIARRLGKRVGDQLGIPVYLYEDAATRPDRQNLENIRRGQYEGLKAEISSNPDRQPDFGPNQLPTAGATVIGARQPLIAYNVYLTTEDVTIAKKVAKALRYSSGGLRFVKALGLLVEGRAQVSMNLTNFHETPVARVVEMVRREAERYGVGVHHCELVGLIPQEALVDAAVWYLQLDQFEPEQILESKLYAAAQETGETEVTTGSESEPFLSALAAGTPAPGGGSAAAYSGAMGAALVAMVARLTIGKKKYIDVEPVMQELLEKAENLRQDLTLGIQRDAVAFEEVMAAYKLPKDSEAEQEQRLQAIEAAMLKATEEPLATARLAVEVMALAQQAATLGNINTITDAGTGAALGRAALVGAGLNVRENLKNLHDANRVAQIADELANLEAVAVELDQSIRKCLQERGAMLYS